MDSYVYEIVASSIHPTHGSSAQWDYPTGIVCLFAFLFTTIVCSVGLCCTVETSSESQCDEISSPEHADMNPETDACGTEDGKTVNAQDRRKDKEEEKEEEENSVDMFAGVSLQRIFFGLLDIISVCEDRLNSSHETVELVRAYDSALRSLFYFMHVIQHPNSMDLNHVCQILSQEEHPESDRALQWLLVARHLWRTHPSMVMVPWEASVPKQELPKEC